VAVSGASESMTEGNVRQKTKSQNMLPLILTPNSQNDESGEKACQPPNSDPTIENEPNRSIEAGLAARDPVADDMPSRRTEKEPSPSENEELLSLSSSHPPLNFLHEPAKLPDVENVQKHVTTSARYYPRLGQKFSTTSWKEFKYQDHSLRINASDIAAVTGFHPYRSLAKVLMNHIYQGRAGQQLKEHDAELLGIAMISEDQVLLELAKKAGAETSNALQSAMQVKSGNKKLETVEIADKVKKKVLEEAKKSKKLSKVELKQLEEAARDSVNTGFGNAWEDKALDMYERQCGWEVRDRNVEVRTWSFRKENNNDNDASVTPMAPAYAPVREIFSSHTLAPNPKKQKTQEVVDLVGESPSIDGVETIPKQESVANDSLLDGADRREKPLFSEPPFFSIRGAVDGIREELAPSGNPALTPGSPGDDNSWVLNRVIVECKHRMSRLQASPPLYEQIQTTAYCLMYEVQDADIVQVLRKQLPRARRKSKPKPSTKSKREDENMLPVSQFFSSKSSEKENTVKGVQDQNAPTVGSGNNTKDTSKAQPKEPADTGSTPPCDTLDSKGGDVPKPPVYVPCDSQQEQVEESSSSTDTDTANTTSPVDDHVTILEIGVNRVSLDDPILQHRHNWNNIILPRLRSWTDAVYTVKRCDDKRYRLLQSMIEPPDLAQAWQILFEECPWFVHCDTAYHRDISS
jgi:hypothetical protein